MIIISSREFRQNQRMYFDKVDNGEQIVVQRGKDKSYALTAISEEDKYFNKEMLKKIQKSVKQIKEGKYSEINSAEEIKELLGL